MKQTKKLPKEQIAHYLHALRRNTPLIVIVFLLAVYAFLGWRISNLMLREPDDTEVSAKLSTIGVPNVDPKVVIKIQQLKDNSVSVQTLFDQSRDNPFSE